MSRTKEIEQLLKGGSLARYAFSLCRNKEEADDLVMDIITKLLEKQYQISEDVPLEAYAIRAIKNRFLDKIKVKNRFSDVQGKSDENDFFGQLADDLAEARVVSPIILRQTLGSLDEKCRELLLRFANGSSYRQLADEMGAKIGTITSRMARCREELSTTLGI